MIGATRAAAQRNVGKAIDTADDFVTGNPWRAVAVAVGIGLTVAFIAMLSTRGGED